MEEQVPARSHLLRSLLELDTDSSRVHRFHLRPVPGNGTDHGLGDDPAETAVPFYEDGVHALSRGCQRSGAAARPAAYDQHIRLRHDEGLPGWFFDLSQFT